MKREQELKYAVPSRQHFLELRDGPRWGTRSEEERQTNYYFDTPGQELMRSRLLLRIRRIAPVACVLTLKCGIEVKPGFFDSLELEAEVDPTFLQAALARPASLLDLPLEPMEELRRRLGRPALSLAGILENVRVRRGVPPFTLEVDRLVFPDGSEAYELEIEAEDVAAAEAWAARALQVCDIRVVPQRLTKMERLLEWLGRS